MTTHDPQARAAVLAGVLAGKKLIEIAREQQIPESTVRLWRDQAGLGPKAPRNAGYLAEEKKKDLGVLVGEYLDDILVSLRAQAIHTRDPEWLARQNAHDLAILHGVLSDKAVRLLGALRVDEPIKLPDAPPA